MFIRLKRSVWVVLVCFCFSASVHSDFQEYDAFEFFDLLRASKFSELESILTKLQRGYEQGRHGDRLVSEAFYRFSNSDKRLERFFTNWVDENPESYSA